MEVTRPQKKRATTEYLEKRSEMGTAGFKYNRRKMQAAAQDRTGWRKVVYGLMLHWEQQGKSRDKNESITVPSSPD